MSDQPNFDFRLEPPNGWVPQSEDAVYAVERLQFDHWRAMSARERVALLDQHSAFIRELCLAGMRLRHPMASEAEIELMAAELWLGADLFARLVAPGDQGRGAMRT